MPELIDKIEALGKLQTMYIQIECACGDGNLVAKGVRKAYKAIERMPTIESEPVRRGHWVLTRDEQYEYCHCSECGYDTGENWMIGSEIPYCSQCGSKNYDGGADND